MGGAPLRKRPRVLVGVRWTDQVLAIVRRRQVHRGPEYDRIAMPERRRTPQEKKQLSYVRDRRDDYAESNKGPRKSVPRAKRRAARAGRRVARQQLPKGQPVEALVADAESIEVGAVTAYVSNRGRGKSAGAPLAEHVVRRLQRRESLELGTLQRARWYDWADVVELGAEYDLALAKTRRPMARRPI